MFQILHLHLLTSFLFLNAIHLLNIMPCMHAAAAAKSLQSCLTLCDPIDGSPPGSPIPGILQARTLERVAISFSNAWKWKVKVKSLSRVRLLGTPRTATYLAPPSMGFARQEYWSGLPLPSPAMHAYLSANSYSFLSCQLKCYLLYKMQSESPNPVLTQYHILYALYMVIIKDFLHILL